MPQPDGNLIPVYMTEVDWSTLITELDHSIDSLHGLGFKDLPVLIAIIKDNIERQTGL